MMIQEAFPEDGVVIFVYLQDVLESFTAVPTHSDSDIDRSDVGRLALPLHRLE